jgi:signal transduction histidine kinase
LALAIPTAVLVLSVIGARLDEAGRRVDAGAARVASAWLADRVGLLPEENRAGFLAEAGREMGAAVGLYDRERGFVPGAALAGVAAADVERALTGGIEELVVAGAPHQIATASLRAPLSRLSVVVALPRREGEPTRSETQARLGALAVLFLLAGGIFAAGLGLDAGHGLEALARRVAGAGRTPAGPVPDRTPEFDELWLAAARLERRLERPGGPEPSPEEGPADQGGGDLLTSVAQGLNRPLGRIVETTGWLLEGRSGELGPSQREDLLVIRQAGDRLLGLVGDLLDLTSLLEDDLRLEFEPVVLAEVAGEVLRAARGELKRKQLDLDLEAPDEPPLRVRGNRLRLWQVLTNLVSNGIKFTERGGVTVRIRRDPEAPGRVRLEVEDTGVGIPSLEQATVFDTFRQLGNRARGQRGAGLGLAICRRLVELHGGSIRVDSRPGSGARFVALLPEEP